MKTAMSRSHGFHWLPFTTALLLFGAVTLSAQVVPATPKKFTKRDLGGGSASIGPSTITPPPTQPPIVRMTTYFALSDSRQWTSADGKPLLAKLVAFEDIVVETQGNPTQVATSAQPPAMPTNPTVVRDGKVRLLSGKAPYEVPLDRLSQPDRDFVENIRTAVANKNAAAPAAAPGAPEKK